MVGGWADRSAIKMMVQFNIRFVSVDANGQKIVIIFRLLVIKC